MSAIANPSAQAKITNANSARRFVAAIVATLEPLALSLWLGGLLIIGAVVAPVAFHALRDAPALQGNPQLQNQMAGSIVGHSLKVLNGISIICFGLLIGNLVPEITIGKARREIGLLVVAVAISIIQQQFMFPIMDSAQAAGDMTTFDSYHHLYVDLTYIQVVLLLIYASLRNQRRWKTESA